MKSHRSALRAACLAAALAALHPLAWSQANVQAELVAEKLVRTPAGEVSRQPAAAARPGDTVVYTAKYRNSGKDAARALVATVPVPAGMDYQGTQPGDKLAPALASLDGRSFAPVPLTRKVRTPQGEVVQQVPLAEYRFLRWNLPELAAGATVSVQLAARVSTNP